MPAAEHKSEALPAALAVRASTGRGQHVDMALLDTQVGVLANQAMNYLVSGKPPRRSVMFLAVTAEEKGLIGADYFAQNPTVPKDRIVANVNLDMPVLTYDFTDVIAFGAEHSTLGPIAARALASAGVKLSPDPMPDEGVFTRSDHYSFVVEGVPSIMLATGFAGPGRDQFMGFLKNRYHKPNDDLTQDFNWSAGAKFARINYLIARGIADGAEAPRWYAGNFFGETFAKDAPKAPTPVGDPIKGK